ncbi:hypothetical protein SDC9_176455 [bioreactor metagenome]|uniref:Uncharacterized protein n=1 Tax=bioreactor metagenome TaxID=1076179 RepID=A0A645GQ47_9ZZZZ
MGHPLVPKVVQKGLELPGSVVNVHRCGEHQQVGRKHGLHHGLKLPVMGTGGMVGEAVPAAHAEMGHALGQEKLGHRILRAGKAAEKAPGQIIGA